MGQEQVIFEKEKKNNNNNQKEHAAAELNQLAQESSRVILDVSTVFPFDFFPDKLVLDEMKVSIHTSYFFYSKEIQSIEYKDISHVLVQQGLFFAKLEIFAHQPIPVEYLRKNDAIRARRMIQGMIIAKKENIPIETLPIEQLIQKLDEIGRTP